VRYIRVYPLIFVLFAACCLSAQANYAEPLAQALALQRRGQTAPAITALGSLLDSKSLTTAETGEAWNILGLCYRDQGNFESAQHAFELSIRMLEDSPNHTREYGMALDNFGGLLLAKGQAQAAGKIRERALRVYEKTNDHTGLAIASSNLAGLAFGQKRVRQGRKYLERSRKEAQLASDLDDDILAAISSMQGWLALLDGEIPAAVSAYQHSLDLWRKRHGEQHPFTGWGYVLLGASKAQAGEFKGALADMRLGLAVLERTLGRQNARYLTAEIAYSRVLDQTGARSEAARMKKDAERDLQDLHRSQCAECTISAEAFR
jgi:tetratricopeptide (TPR) repeat protein